MIRLVRGEEIDLLQAVVGYIFVELFGIIHGHARRSQRVQGAQANVAVVGVNLVGAPGIEGEQHIRLRAPDGMHQLATQRECDFYFSIVMTEKSHLMHAQCVSGMTLLLFANLCQPLHAHTGFVAAAIAARYQHI